MRRSSWLARGATVSAFLAATLIPQIGHSQSEADRRCAMDAYIQGRQALDLRHWPEARDAFLRSYRCVRHPMTAYGLSVCFMNMQAVDEASTYASAALGGSPHLGDPYRSDALAIEEWVDQARQGRSELDAKADAGWPRPLDVARPSSTLVLGARPDNHGEGLTGKWNCNDGGVYFIRQVGNAIWWYGYYRDNSKAWANVYHGQLSNGTIRGEWADLPMGGSRNSGKLELKVESKSHITRLGEGGGFGGSVWTREPED